MAVLWYFLESREDINRHKAAEIIVTFGVLFSLLISITVYLLQKLRGAVKIIQEEKDTYEKEIAVRQQAEEQIQRLVSQLEIEKRYAEKSAITDGLTGLANRRHFDEALRSEYYRSKRSGHLLSLIMIDIDYFKMFNDTYGHVTGDECLRQVASAIRTIVHRAPDMAARYGGEEFAVMLPNTELQGAAAVAEHIRKAVEDLALPHTASLNAGNVTVSLGVATLSAAEVSAPEAVVALADEALYSAKEQGRNRLEVTTCDNNPACGNTDFVRLVWSITNECGNLTIDEQHRKLFMASNELLSAFLGNHAKDRIVSLIDNLLTDIANHFRDEESIFCAAEYPFSAAHIQCHSDLMAKATVLAEKYVHDELTPGELFSFLAQDVIAHHLFTEDRKFIPYVVQQ